MLQGSQKETNHFGRCNLTNTTATPSHQIPTFQDTPLKKTHVAKCVFPSHWDTCESKSSAICQPSLPPPLPAALAQALSAMMSGAQAARSSSASCHSWPPWLVFLKLGPPPPKWWRSVFFWVSLTNPYKKGYPLNKKPHAYFAL